MVLKIRLARFGKKHSPIYNIVVAQARSARGSKPLEVIGVYNPKPQVPLSRASDPDYEVDADGTPLLDDKGRPVPFKPKKVKDVQLDQLRTKYWLGVGAQPTETVERLLCLIGLLEPKPGRIRPGSIMEKVEEKNRNTFEKEGWV